MMNHRKFFTAELSFGPGNQMFQIAHAVAQGWKHDREVVFLQTENFNNPQWKYSEYRDNIFRNVIVLAEGKGFQREMVEFYPVHWNIIPDITSEDIGDFDVMKFNGYYQSDKNFLGYDEDIQELFSPTKEFVERMYNKYPELNGNTVSVNLRRGDYFNYPNTHPVCNDTYFINAINELGGYETVFLVSDDIPYIQNNLKLPRRIVVDDLKPYEQLWLMSLCKHNIISNSTFSWWGAFLNKNENKEVFAPDKWFGPEGPQPHDNIYVKGWNRIPVTFKNGYFI